MGTLAAGIKEIFATAKTTGSNVMLCGNDGTPDGHMTMANLASVLGVVNKTYNFDITVERCSSLEQLVPIVYDYLIENAPINNDKLMFSGVANGQFAKCFVWGYLYESGGIYGRINAQYEEDAGFETFTVFNGVIGATQNVSTNIPDFYKSYANLSSLANALGVGHITTTSDANTAYPSTGMFAFYANTDRQNAPVNADGYILSLRWPTDTFVLQFYMDDRTNYLTLWNRTYNGTSWSAWHQL